MNRVMNGLLALAALVACVTPARGQVPDPQDYRVIQKVPRVEADRWLKDEVARSGGNFDRDRYHFVFGFSTGHYGSDPVHAIAMRRIVFSWLNNTLAPGDRVTPTAWEMDLWDTGKAVDLTADPKTRAAFVDLVSFAPKPESLGGHDTERALYETATRVVRPADASSTIVILVTNTNQSQGPTGQRVQLFGANNPKLARVLSQLGYRSPVRHSFAAEAKGKPLTIDVTALFPKAMKSLTGAPTGARYPGFPLTSWQPAADQPAESEKLPNAAAAGDGGTGGGGAGAGGGAGSGGTGASGAGSGDGGSGAGAPGTAPLAPTPDASDQAGQFPWQWLLLGIAILAGILWFLFGRKKGAKPAEPVRKAKPFPGKIAVSLGSAPQVTRSELSGLNSESAWLLSLDPSSPARVSWLDANPPPGPDGRKPDPPAAEAVLANGAVDDRGRLKLDAEGDTVFLEIQGVNTAASNSRLLLIAPGERLVCRVSSASRGGSPTRLELQYGKD